MTIKDYNKDMEFLLPMKLKDYVEPSDNCLLVEKVIESMKGTKRYKKEFKKYKKAHKFKPGQSAYNMEMMLTIIIAGAIDGIFSARKLSKAVKRDVAYMYLSGYQMPDHSTISRFKNEHKELIKYVFESTVELAKKAGMLNLSRIAVDGSKYKANAGLNKKILAKEDFLPEDALERLFTADKEEDEIYGDKDSETVMEDLQTQNKVNNLIKKQLKEDFDAEMTFTEPNKVDQEKIDEAIDKAIKDNAKVVSTTDKEARFMKSHNQAGFFFNVQHVVDGNHFIIAMDINNESNDYNSFIPLYEQANENVDGLPENCQVLADNGYSNKENIEYCENNNIDAYIQSRQLSTLNNNKNPIDDFSLLNFYWNEEKQGYICPGNQILTHQGKTPKIGIYYTTQCLQCQFKEKCTPNKKYRRIYSEYTDEQKRMMDKMSQDSSKNIYKHRMGMVEHTFGHDKHNLKSRQVDPHRI
ncbi:MAG: transposase [Methanobrevibacter sp. CfCl-M3]